MKVKGASRPRAWRIFLALVISAGSAISAEKVETLVMKPADHMTRAELHSIRTVDRPEAVLVFVTVSPAGEGMGPTPPKLVGPVANQDSREKAK